jgi:hypothetical protein
MKEVASRIVEPMCRNGMRLPEVWRAGSVGGNMGRV